MGEINFNAWKQKYFNDKIIDINSCLNKSDIEILKNLNIFIENKIYTISEYEIIKFKLFLYYTDEEETEEERNYKKKLEDTVVTEEQFNKILKQFEKIDKKYDIF